MDPPALNTHRTLHTEWMDNPALDAREHDEALAGLARINRVSGTVSAVWAPLRALALRHGRLRVMDLACGGGDVAVALAQCARTEGLPIEMHGCDRSGRALLAAKGNAERAGVELGLVEASVLSEDFPKGYDVYMSTLFLHHLNEEQSVELLLRMAGGRAFIVDDLRRTKFGFLIAKWGVRFLTRSPVVWNDAPVSVQNAYTLDEVRGLLQQAGLPDANLDTHWPQRFQIRWERN
jgi:2-polyprenyl-3-methyl-5-hydroxy-6-metoxy-1,4-benzoquinol methylase